MQQRTIQILKNMATISTRILFREGVNVAIRNDTGSIYAFAKLNETDKITKQFAIFDLNEFLAVYSLFDDPQIEHHDGYLTLKDKNTKKAVRYVYANPATVAETPTGNFTQKNKQISFVLSKDSLDSAVKGASIMRLADMRVNSDGVTILNHSRGNTDDGNTYEVDVMDFKFSDEAIDETYFIAFGELKLIPDTYTVTLSPECAVFTSSQNDLMYLVMYKVVN